MFHTRYGSRCPAPTVGDSFQVKGQVARDKGQVLVIRILYLSLVPCPLHTNYRLVEEEREARKKSDRLKVRLKVRLIFTPVKIAFGRSACAPMGTIHSYGCLVETDIIPVLWCPTDSLLTLVFFSVGLFSFDVPHAQTYLKKNVRNHTGGGTGRRAAPARTRRRKRLIHISKIGRKFLRRFQISLQKVIQRIIKVKKLKPAKKNVLFSKPFGQMILRQSFRLYLQWGLIMK